MDNSDTESTDDAPTDLPVAPPASVGVLAEWDAVYEKAWKDRDLRAHSNDVFSLERESGETVLSFSAYRR